MAVFWVVGALGAVLFVLSLLVGDLFHGVVDAVDFTGGYLSTAAVGGFAAAFGIAGASFTAATGAGPVAGSLVGVAAGLVMAAFAVSLTRVVSAMPTDRALTTSDLVGREAVVVTRIPAGSYGEIALRVGGHPLKLNAKADAELAAGSTVFVVETLSTSAVRVMPY